jgi:predicted kinase
MSATTRLGKTTHSEEEARTSAKALIVMAGPQLVGKTSFSKKISSRFGIRVIDVDEMKFALFGDAATEIGADKEREAHMIGAAYGEMYRRARQVLDSGEPVITVATHSREVTHELAKATAKEAGVPLIVVSFDITKVPEIETFLRERLRNRLERKDGGLSNIIGEEGIELAKSTWARYIPLRSGGNPEIIEIPVNLTEEEGRQEIDLMSVLTPLLRRTS